MPSIPLTAACFLATCLAASPGPGALGAEAPEARAIAYLGREVPRWQAENRCFSCHNDGDAARALFRAARLGLAVPDAATAGTVRWLERPEGWDRNGGDGPFNDKVLARIQFAAALADAIDAGRSGDAGAMARAAGLVAGDQIEGGSWRVDAEAAVGSPATYGTALATAMARRSLVAAGPKRFAAPIAAADRWLRKAEARNVPDAAAVLIGLEGADDAEAAARVRRGLDLIRRAEAARGGWGPFPNTPAEPFDTAVVLIALAPRRGIAERAGWIRRGRAFLIASQHPDGSWPETTRPPDGESYAERLSTSGWALQALLATRDEEAEKAVPGASR
ncbi:hypothetical protein OJF2_42550 [Aquisphaera giovannonii]|uniref:Squalene cyclase C-terminal domain-containing protein n=1 Tax=Aquisphaera giovannonii TaxID=406548 RepID=A0A5B9W564_9BACT|nr:hypothetical protein [Aquisphaera giovannonii]QEH35698.1 hypothetical protein OJF2_42550 [Aquisphaera giovannonii]